MKASPNSTRRCVLMAGAAALASPWVRRARADAAAGDPILLGAVLPIGGEVLPRATVNRKLVGEAARMGLVLAEEELGRNAALLGRSLEIAVSNAPGAEAAHRAARRLAAREGVRALIGGFSREEAEALGEVAEEFGILFFNVGATSDSLRQADCRRHSFHVEASAAMYLDALLGWFVRAGFRNWYFVHDDTAEGGALYERTLAALGDRHWGAEEAGSGVMRAGGRDLEPLLRDIRAAAPDVVLLLTDWLAQLDFLARYEAAGLTHPVTGFPEPTTQLREFFAMAQGVAPTAGTGHRAVLWEATLDAYGARELNARFAGRWGRAMDPSAWTAYQATKIFLESVLFAGTQEGGALADYLTSERAVFDVHKGIGVSFRPWDHQLRQSLFLVDINPPGASRHGLELTVSRASLVGELPAIFMPGTDPIERLDQLGDIVRAGSCG